MNQPNTTSLVKNRMQRKSRNVDAVSVPSNDNGLPSPPSPGHQTYLLKMKEQAQKSAFEELLETMAKNGGKLPRGSVVELVRKFEKHGCDYVSEDNLRYRLKKL
jgi:hypothetical protein